jgi:hypothetical protein
MFNFRWEPADGWTGQRSNPAPELVLSAPVS